MKKVLSLLVTFVFLQVQTWALSGGPVFGSGRLGASVSGVYAGVLVPKKVNRIFQNPSFTPNAQSDRNTIGIFVLTVPQTSVATGNFLFFQDGEAFFGDMQGVVDPASATLTALVAGAAATNNLSSGVEFFSPVSAVGSVKAELVPGRGVLSALRLRGTAEIQMQGFAPDASPNGFGFTTIREITFVVDGFKQTDDFTQASTIAPPNTTSIPAPAPTFP